MWGGMGWVTEAHCHNMVAKMAIIRKDNLTQKKKNRDVFLSFLIRILISRVTSILFCYFTCGIEPWNASEICS